MHTSEGKYLVTRLIPCLRCFPSDLDQFYDTGNNHGHSSGDGKLFNAFSSPSKSQNGTISSSTSNALQKLEFLRNFGVVSGSRSPRMSSDSGVGTSPSHTCVDKENNNEENAVKTRVGDHLSNYSRNYSGLNYFLKGPNTSSGKRNNVIYSWSVEFCILRSQKFAESSTISANQDLSVKCPKHGNAQLSEISPDILFLDLNSKYLLNNSDIGRGALLGRGAFGFVFSGKLVPKYDTKAMEIAIKMFQPIDPGMEDLEAYGAYKVAKSKWFRSPAQSACRAYIAARGEVRVLYWVSHPNIVPFLGLCQSPLSIVMPKAPRGALDVVLSDFKRSGGKVQEDTMRMCILQVRFRSLCYK